MVFLSGGGYTAPHGAGDENLRLTVDNSRSRGTSQSEEDENQQHVRSLVDHIPKGVNHPFSLISIICDNLYKSSCSNE